MRPSALRIVDDPVHVEHAVPNARGLGREQDQEHSVFPGEGPTVVDLEHVQDVMDVFMSDPTPGIDVLETSFEESPVREIDLPECVEDAVDAPPDRLLRSGIGFEVEAFQASDHISSSLNREPAV